MRRHGSVKTSSHISAHLLRVTKDGAVGMRRRLTYRRRLSLLVTVAIGGMLVATAPAAPAAGPAAKPVIAPAVKGAPVCKITDARLSEISGMVTIGNEF